VALAAVAGSDDQDELVGVDFVQDPVVADPYAQHSCHPGQGLRASWPRLRGEPVDRCPDPFADLPVQGQKRFAGTQLNNDLVGHAG